MHPAVGLAAFILFAIFVPLLGVGAQVAVYAGVLSLLAARARLREYARLLWRVRFVWLALGAACLLGGAFDQANWRAWLRSVLYLAALLGALQLCVLSQPRARLLSGLVTLLRPLSALGVPTHVFCVRVLLTLEYAGAARAMPVRDLLARVASGDGGGHTSVAAQQGDEIITLEAQAWRRRDTAALIALSVAFAGASFLFAHA